MTTRYEIHIKQRGGKWAVQCERSTREEIQDAFTAMQSMKRKLRVCMVANGIRTVACKMGTVAMTKRAIRNGPPDTSKAWVAGWDASITFEANPYKRQDYARAFESGRLHGKRSNTNDVVILNRMLQRREPS